MEGRGQSNLEMSRVPEDSRVRSTNSKEQQVAFQGGQELGRWEGASCVTGTELWLYKVKRAVGTGGGDGCVASQCF